MQPLRALVVEDSEDDALLLENAIQRYGFALTWRRVDDPASMLAVLATREWDIILCDYNMPRFSVDEAIALLKSRRLDIPVIVVSGSIGEERAAELMRSGVRDLLNKSALERLGPAIEREIAEAKTRRDRRRAEAELRESEARLHSLAANLPGTIYQRVQHADGHISYPFIGESIRDLYGYEAQEVMRNPALFSSRPTIGKQEFDDAMEKSARDLKPFNWVGQDTKKNGESFWFYFVTRPRRLENKDVVWDSLILDTTEQRKAQEQLLETTALLESVAANVPGMIYKHVQRNDGASQYTYVSEGAYRLYGYTPQEFMANSTLFGEKVIEDPKAVQIKLAESARTLQPFTFAGRERRKDGSWFWARTLAHPRRTAGGDTVWDGIVFDITDLKNAETQLVQAAKLATLGEMAAGLTHELNQPLSIIMMTADSAIMAAEDGPVESEHLLDQMAVIQGQAVRMAAMTDHMRLFSRKDAMESEIFDPAVQVRNAVKFMSDQIHIAGIVVEENIPAETAPIRGYPIQIEQVAVNLLGNAKDAIAARRGALGNKEYPGRIAVRLAHDVEENRVRLEVRDNGGGIPDEILKHIFEPFFTTKEAGKGTGLGLSIAHTIITSIGGTISVKNDDEGACFSIDLPVHAQPGGAVDSA